MHGNMCIFSHTCVYVIDWTTFRLTSWLWLQAAEPPRDAVAKARSKENPRVLPYYSDKYYDLGLGFRI